MTHFSLTGCQSGKSIQITPPLTLGQLSHMTARVRRCLLAVAPRGFAEATKQAALLKVMAELWSRPGISDGLIVRTTFSTLTRQSHYNGRIRLQPLPDSPFFKLTLTETAEVGGVLLAELWEVSEQRLCHPGGSIYRVWTSQRTIAAEALPLQGQSFGQFPESRLAA